MAEKNKDRGSPAERPTPKAGHETADVAFDEIIDAILGADPDAVREQRDKRSARRPTKSKRAT